MFLFVALLWGIIRNVLWHTYNEGEIASVTLSFCIFPPDDCQYVWPKHVVENKNEWIYEGWNFNSGNYLFTTDTK